MCSTVVKYSLYGKNQIFQYCFLNLFQSNRQLDGTRSYDLIHLCNASKMDAVILEICLCIP